MLNISFGALENSSVLAYTGSVSLIPSNSTSTVLTLTANGVNRITRIACSGDDYAKWEFYVNNILKETRRTGPKRNTDFVFNYSYLLASGDVVDVKVTHYFSGQTLNFESTIYGYKN